MKIESCLERFVVGLRLFVITFLVSVSCSWGSTTEARRRSDRIVYAGPDGKVEITLSGLRNGGQIQVSVKFGDKVIKVPKRFLFGAKDIVEESGPRAVFVPRLP